MQSSKKISFNSYTRLIVICLVALVCILGYWIYRSYIINPQQVFNGMLLNNLNTNSYVVIDQSQGLQGSTIQQTVVDNGAQNIAMSRETNIIGSGNMIQTLSVGTPATDYSSYQKIEVGKTSSHYLPIIGKWGTNSPEGPKGQGGQLYKSMVLTPFLFSSPSTSDTTKLMNFIRNNKVYSVVSSKLLSLNGTQALNLKININLKQYSKLLNLYSGMIGYTNRFSNVQYNGTQVVQIEATVATLSRQLEGLTYIGSSSVQVYESYGLKYPIKIPSKSIPLQLLKNEISALSK